MFVKKYHLGNLAETRNLATFCEQNRIAHRFSVVEMWVEADETWAFRCDDFIESERMRQDRQNTVLAEQWILCDP